MTIFPRVIQQGRIAALLFFCLLSQIQAHGVRNDVRVEITPVAIAGLVVELHQDLLAPQLVVSNHSGKTLEILDDQGRAFLRFDGQRAEADFAAEAYHLARISGGGDARAKTLSATPRWAMVNKEPSYGWFDPRIATAPLKIPPGIEQLDDELPFGEWRIPARLGGAPIEFRGVFVYTPPPKGVAVARLTARSAQPAAGVTVMLSPGPTPALFLSNSSAQEVAVLDDQGAAFLKISKAGVWADVGSAAWRATGANVEADASGWRQLSKSNSHTWLEPRAAWRGVLPKPLPANHIINQWQVPLSIGDAPAAIVGVNQWIARPAVASNNPPSNRSHIATMKNLLLVAIGLVVLGGLFFWMKPPPAPLPLAMPAATASTTAPTAVAVPSPTNTLFEIEVREHKLFSGPAVLSVMQGTPVILKITSDIKDELHLHGYDLTLELPAGQPAELSFVADRSGRFEYELHHAHLELGALEVQPQ